MPHHPKRPYKAKVFEKYVFWKSMPTVLRTLDISAFAKLGLGDPEYTELINIKTQHEFSELFDLDQGTLSGWNKKIAAEDLVRKYYPDTFVPLYKNALTRLMLRMASDPSAAGLRVLHTILYGKGVLLIEPSATKSEAEKEEHVLPEYILKERSRILELAYGKDSEDEPLVNIQKQENEKGDKLDKIQEGLKELNKKARKANQE